jgi:hypothetical protein
MNFVSKLVILCLSTATCSLALASSTQAQLSFMLNNGLGINQPGTNDISGINTSNFGDFLKTGGVGAVSEMIGGENGAALDLSFLQSPFGQALVNSTGRQINVGTALNFLTSTKSGEEWVKNNPEIFAITSRILNGDNQPFRLSAAQSVQDYRRNIRTDFANDLGSKAISSNGLITTAASAKDVAAAAQANKTLAGTSVESTKQSMDLMRQMINQSTQVQAKTNSEIQEVKTVSAASIAMTKTILEQEQERKQQERNDNLTREKQLLAANGAATGAGGVVNWYATFGSTPQNASEQLLPDSLRRGNNGQN